MIRTVKKMEQEVRIQGAHRDDWQEAGLDSGTKKGMDGETYWRGKSWLMMRLASGTGTRLWLGRMGVLRQFYRA
jgi:hypothetical protein